MSNGTKTKGLFCMNVSDFLIPAGILLWAAFEYHRREQLHRETMAYLRNGVEPPPQLNIPKTLHLWTVGGTAFLLLALSIGFLVLAIGAPTPQDSVPFVVLAVPFIAMAILLLLILRRDLKLRKQP
jgi:hypothetical protein